LELDIALFLGAGNLSTINVYNEFLTEKEQVEILNYLKGPVFSGTHTSNGDVDNQRLFFRANLESVDLFLNLIPKITQMLPTASYKLVRCWAIAHQTGSHGDIHQDTGGDFSVIIYPHETWHVNWGGETIFFDPKALGKLSLTSLLTLTVTKPPGDRHGFLLQVIFVVIEGSCESKSCALSPAAEFAARLPLASLLETTNARAAVRAEISVAK
jgi:hypothetical protein